jgi:hypothetical protein
MLFKHRNSALNKDLVIERLSLAKSLAICLQNMSWSEVESLEEIQRSTPAQLKKQPQAQASEPGPAQFIGACQIKRSDNNKNNRKSEKTWNTPILRFMLFWDYLVYKLTALFIHKG